VNSGGGDDSNSAPVAVRRSEATVKSSLMPLPGFALAREHVAELIDDLIAEFAREHEDHGLRCWLLELIGEARVPRAFPILAEQLRGPDEALRSWARVGLESLGTKEARRELWKARANGWTPEAASGLRTPLPP
jgi:HEAT repeat protein